MGSDSRSSTTAVAGARWTTSALMAATISANDSVSTAAGGGSFERSRTLRAMDGMSPEGGQGRENPLLSGPHRTTARLLIQAQRYQQQ